MHNNDGDANDNTDDRTSIQFIYNNDDEETQESQPNTMDFEADTMSEGTNAQPKIHLYLH